MRARSPKVLRGSEQSWQSQNRRVPHTWTADRGAAAQSESPAVQHVLSTTASAEHRCCLITEPQLKRRAVHISSPALSSLTSLCHIPPRRGLIPVERQCSPHTQQTYHFLYFTVSLTLLSLIRFLASLLFICFLSSYFISSFLPTFIGPPAFLFYFFLPSCFPS